MKRAAPEEAADVGGPLFELAEKQAAQERASVGMARAAGKAERIDPGWKATALETVRAHALRFQFFLTEDVEFVIPLEADPRAVGGVMRAATSAGFIVADGVARANSSNRSHKTRWRSLINQRQRET